MTTAVGWYRYTFALRVVEYGGPREDTRLSTLLQSLVRSGPSVFPDVHERSFLYSSLPYWGVAPKGYWTDEPSWYSTKTFHHTSTQYIVLERTVTEVVTLPDFVPGTISGGVTSVTLRSDASGFEGMDFTVEHVGYSWGFGSVDIFDSDGNGYDDYGEHDAGPAAPRPLTPASPDGPVPESADEELVDWSLENLFTSMEVAAYQAEAAAKWEAYVQKIGHANPGRIFEKLSSVLGPAAMGIDIGAAAAKVHAASQDPDGDPWRTAFVEFSLLVEEQTLARGAQFASSAVVTPVGGVVVGAGVSVLYREHWRDSRQAAYENLYDTYVGGNGSPGANGAFAAALGSGPTATDYVMFDARFYLAAYPDAADAVRSGAAASALAHFVAVGAGAGYLPSAGALPVDPAELTLNLPAGAAAGPRVDLFAVPLGGMAGDGESWPESALRSLVAVEAGASQALQSSRTLTALANRMAIDAFSNYRESALERQAAGQLHTGELRTSAGDDLQEYFPATDLSQVRILISASASTGWDEALSQLRALSLSAYLPSAASIGVAEYGGVWVLLLGPSTVADGAPPAEAGFQVSQLGTDGDDILAAGTAAAYRSGQGGNDIIFGGALADGLDGDDGDDFLAGGEGNDRLDGGAGADRLQGGAGADSLTGGAGGDEVRGNSGNDFLFLQHGGDDGAFGGDGNDVLYFGTALSAGDVADGGSGRDAIVLQGNVTAALTDANLAGIESISIQSGANAFFGDTANNFYDTGLTTADGNVAAGQQMIVNAQSLRVGEDFAFDGSAETDGKFVVYAGHGVDDLTGGDGADVFFFEGQRWGPDDRVDGGAGRDSVAISAGSGLNRIEFGADSLTGIESISLNNFFASDPSQKPSYELVLHNGNVASGATLIVNGSSIPLGQLVNINGSGVHDGNLLLFAGGGHDTITGGDGADLILGGGGADSLTGGAGADTFRYDAVSDSAGLADLIGDFQSGVDKIDLSRIDANVSSEGNQAFTWIGSNAFSGSAGELRLYEQGGYQRIEGDTDGDGVADLLIVLQLGTAPLVQGDFML